MKYTTGLTLIPDHTRAGVIRYIEQGIRPGSFLEGVFANDLIKTATHAMPDSLVSLRDYAIFIYNYAPDECYGSREKLEAWIAAGGLRGRHGNDEIQSKD